VLLATLGALALAASVAVVRRRGLRLHLLPLTLAAVSVLSVIGPWSVIAGSRRSQQARLAAAMADAGIDGNATTLTDTIIANEPFREISETTRYLVAHFGPDALPPLFAQHADAGSYRVDVAHAAGLRAARPELNSPRGGFAQLASGARLGDLEGGTLHYFRINRQRASTPADTDTTAAGTSAADTAQGALTVPVRVGGLNLLADLAPISRALVDLEGRSLPPDAARVLLRDETGRVRGELFVIEVGMGGARSLELHMLSGVVRLENR
jgi:hypothetical protein